MCVYIYIISAIQAQKCLRYSSTAGRTLCLTPLLAAHGSSHLALTTLIIDSDWKVTPSHHNMRQQRV